MSTSDAASFFVVQKRKRGRPRKHPLPEGYVPRANNPYIAPGAGGLVRDRDQQIGKFLDYLPDTEEKALVEDSDVIEPTDPDGFLKLKRALGVEDDVDDPSDG